MIEILDAEGVESEAEALGEILYVTVLAGGSVHFLNSLTREEATDYWKGLDDRIVLVARQEGKIVGTGSLIVKTPPNQPHRAEVAKLLVHPNARRQGIARQLVLEIERLARENGRTLLNLDTRTGDDAERLYQSLGYILAGQIPNYAYAPDGKELVSTSLYYKLLI